MKRKLFSLVPAAIVAIALVPSVAQAIPHWTSGGATIANGVKTPVVTFGGAVNLSQISGAGEINCKGVGGGFVENKLAEPSKGTGIGKSQASAFYECKAPQCEAQIKEKFGVSGRGEVRTENLPQPTTEGTLGSEGWENELYTGTAHKGFPQVEEGPVSLREKIGKTFTGFPEGGQKGHPSPAGVDRVTVICSIPALKVTAVEAIFEGSLEPEVGNATEGNFNGITAAHPSEANFTGLNSGTLHSEVAGEGNNAGKVKYLGYVTQAVIGAEGP